jgi:hypothetical protein
MKVTVDVKNAQATEETWPWPVIREIFREIWGVFQGKKFFTKYAKYSA